MTTLDVSTLKGKALMDMAAELNITGRSKMKADELRAAIVEATTPQVTTSVLPNIVNFPDGIMSKGLGFYEREANYMRQNGGERLTGKQAKRLRKKALKAGAIL